jgi:hypothetical protein
VAAAFALLLWVVASLLATGIAIVHRATRLRGIALVAYGAAAGVVWHALVGWAIAAAPSLRWVWVAVLVISAIAGLAYVVLRGALGELSTGLPRGLKISLSLGAGFLVLCLGIVHLDVRFPMSLPDGMYVSKSHSTSVKIQYLTGLPADNYIPFAVSQFFLRGISFKDHRPILPANEVTNRTVLMVLVSLPFHVVRGVPHDHPVLGRYEYLGRQWPDVWQLDEDHLFDDFLVVGLALNSLLLLGVVLFCSGVLKPAVLPLASLLFVTNAYFISHTIFTWPKALAGFFILLAWTSIRLKHSPVVVALLVAAGYHSHPFAMVFAGFIGIFYVVRFHRGELPGSALATYVGAFGVAILPWIVWTTFILQIPSDLIAQNFTGANTEAAWASPVNFVWIRIVNVYTMAAPTMFSAYPFGSATFANQWLSCLPGVTGLVVILPALLQCVRFGKIDSWFWYGLVGPAAAILAVYSCPGLPVLHGYQPLIGVLLFFGVSWLTDHTSPRVCSALLILQLVLNVGFLLLRSVMVGARFQWH